MNRLTTATDSTPEPPPPPAVTTDDAAFPPDRVPPGAEGTPEETPDAGEPWVPDGCTVRDESSANWVVRKIRECRNYATSVAAWAAAETRRAQSEERFLLERYGGQLERWVAACLADGGGRSRSVHLPAGAAGFRRHPPSVQVNDEAMLLAWIESNLRPALKVTVEATGDDAAALDAWLATRRSPCVKATRHVLRGVIADHVRETGECPPGAAIGGGETFYVK